MMDKIYLLMHCYRRVGTETAHIEQDMCHRPSQVVLGNSREAFNQVKIECSTKIPRVQRDSEAM